MNRSELRGWLNGSKAVGPARFVFVVLALHADPSGCAWPSVGTLADLTAMSESTVRRGLSELETAGDVVRELRPGRSTVYQLCPHPSHSDTPTPVTVTGLVQSQGRASPVKSSSNPSHCDTQKGFKTKDVLKGGSGAAPRNGAAARTTAPSPVVTRPDGATFLPGTGWLT